MTAAAVDLQALGVFVRPTVGAAEKVLPVRADLESVLPQGLRRGTIVELAHTGVLFAAMSAAMADGSWAAIVGASTVGIAAAVDHGVVLERLAIVARPPVEQAATVVAALVDAVDLVVVGPGVIVRAGDARRLSSRLRERGGVLFSMGHWPEAVDVRVHVDETSWAGADHGHGHLRQWSLHVRSTGRGAAARERRGVLCLAGGNVDVAVAGAGIFSDADDVQVRAG